MEVGCLFTDFKQILDFQSIENRAKTVASAIDNLFDFSLKGPAFHRELQKLDAAESPYCPKLTQSNNCFHNNNDSNSRYMRTNSHNNSSINSRPFNIRSGNGALSTSRGSGGCERLRNSSNQYAPRHPE